MTTDLNLKKRILESAKEQFLNFGFTKVTTDEIAHELGISKKTLYKHFPQKYRLLEEIVDLKMAELKNGAEHIISDEELEFSKKLEALMTFLGDNIATFLRRPFLRDIQKNAPQIWQKIEKVRKELIFTRFSDLINEGIKKGEFRSDINQHLVMLIYFNAIQNIIHPEVLSEMPFTAVEAFEGIIKTIFEGILTDDARKNYRTF